ncbi:hypothetical protein ACWDNU_47125, partial [Amycolatopsis sp. NPDC003676]
MPITQTLARLAGSCALASVLVAGLLFPLAGGFGFISNRAADAVDNVSAELVEGTVPAVSTMVDANGAPIAWLYEQRRFEVPSDRISNNMKLAIVSARPPARSASAAPGRPPERRKCPAPAPKPGPP